MIKLSGVYIINCKTTDKKIVGESSNIEKRFLYHKQNLKGNRHENPHLQNAWNKYGEEAFEFIILELCDPSETKRLENYWCKLLKTYLPENGYNIRATEDVDKIPMSEETKEKIKISLKLSEKFQNRDSGKGMRGKHHSEESKNKISKSNMGKKMSEKTRQAIIKANTGKIISNEVKERVIKTKKEKNAWGKQSNWWKSRAKSVIQMTKLGEFIREWDSIEEAAERVLTIPTNIGRACKNENFTAAGFKWKFK